ncbi:Protein TRI1 [Halotydeus destructor]|nr:Protein TRI1 [Halotydeus destructor]
MADISSETLSSRIKGMLQGADLETMTAKKVRKQLEQEFNTDLAGRKTEISKIIDDIINSQQSEEEKLAESDSSSVSNEETNVKKKANVDESDDEELARKLQEEEEQNAKRSTRNKASSKKPATKKATKKKRKASSGDDSDSGKEKKKKKSNTGYMKQLPLSADLSDFLGEKELARHEVVKRVWAYCKENELLDPKNKQFALCDEPLMKIVGQKRFRLFGMMKLLGKHFETSQ